MKSLEEVSKEIEQLLIDNNMTLDTVYDGHVFVADHIRSVEIDYPM